jgi:hypothetical protein
MDRRAEASDPHAQSLMNEASGTLTDSSRNAIRLARGRIAGT